MYDFCGNKVKLVPFPSIDCPKYVYKPSRIKDVTLPEKTLPLSFIPILKKGSTVVVPVLVTSRDKVKYALTHNLDDIYLPSA